MFIPRGKTLHDNLATSYVMVDALVEDLCEGGFSGVVEVVLRNTDAYVMIDHGTVVAVIERHETSGGKGFKATTIAQLTARSRVERGRISVYGFAPGATSALANMVDAEPLYTALSTDFADLEKMIAKLRRESDRQWFVEVTTQGGSLALVYIADDGCRVMRSDGIASENTDSETDDRELKQLLEECARVGGTFDVYFKRPGVEPPLPAEPDEPPTQDVWPTTFSDDQDSHQAAVAPIQEPARLDDATVVGSSTSAAVDPAMEDKVGIAAATIESHGGSAASQEPPFVIERNQDHDVESEEDIRQDKDRYWSGTPAAPMFSAAVSASSGSVESIVQPINIDQEETAPEEEMSADAVSLVSEDPVEVEEAEAMAEIKRLMSEIARTIDEASRAVEQRDAFSMYLRAGQLRIADRYPFLDPFGAEFEYLSGEIAFIGKASTAQFKEGLTESLRLAVVGLSQSSAQPARLRAHISEDLDRLLERLRPELERFGLDETIEQIISF